MERKFRINWADLVHEAKSRRLKQKFTQQKLAKIAGVSTPTLSRFENLDKDIQLSSALAILNVVGLVDDRKLVFDNKEAVYIPYHKVVVFWAEGAEGRIKCGIEFSAMRDHFKSKSFDPLQIFNENRILIEQEARRKYLAGKLDHEGRIYIGSDDL